MSLARWNPFLELRSLEDKMNRLFRQARPSDLEEEGLAVSGFAPAVDIYEDESKLSFKLQAPGIDPKDLDIRLDGNNLVISGERKFEKEEKKENYRRIESEYGSFCRSFMLPASADTDKISADYRNGVLNIDIPKRAEAKGKQIAIGGQASTSPQKPQEKKIA